MKICAKCKEEKDAIEFNKSKDRKDGLNPYCKSCCKQYRTDNRDRLKEAKREYYYRDVDAMRKKLRDRYAENSEQVLEKQREFYSTVDGRKKKILSKTKEGARKRGLEFNLELDDIDIPTHCPYLGIELTHDLGKGQLQSNSSIDRIDPSKGYVKGNVQIISRKANTMKSDATEDELVAFAKAVLKKYL